MPVLHMVMSLSVSSAQAAAMMALVDAMAGMMFLTTPPVSCHVTPCPVTHQHGSQVVVSQQLSNRPWPFCHHQRLLLLKAYLVKKQVSYAPEPQGNVFLGNVPVKFARMLK